MPAVHIALRVGCRRMDVAVILSVHGVDGSCEGDDLKHSLEIIPHKLTFFQVINSYGHGRKCA